MSEYLHLFRQNNILIALVFFVVGGAAFLWYRRLGSKWWKLWACYSLVVAGLLVSLRTPAATLTEHFTPRESDDDDSAVGPLADKSEPGSWQPREFEPKTVEEIRDLLRTGGKPTLVAIYSDYGLASVIEFYPAVSRLKDQWTFGRVLRLNILSAVNKKYAKTMGVERTPTFLLFNAQGYQLRRWIDKAPRLDELPSH